MFDVRSSAQVKPAEGRYILSVQVSEWQPFFLVRNGRMDVEFDSLQQHVKFEMF